MLKEKPDQYILDQMEVCRDAWSNALTSTGLGLREEKSYSIGRGDSMTVTFTTPHIPKEFVRISLDVEVHDKGSDVQVSVHLRVGAKDFDNEKNNWVHSITDPEFWDNNLPVEYWTDLSDSERVHKGKIKQLTDVLEKLIARNEQRLSALPRFQAAVNKLADLLEPLVEGSQRLPVAEVQVPPTNDTALRSTSSGTFYGYFNIYIKNAFVGPEKPFEIAKHLKELADTAISRFSDSEILFNFVSPSIDLNKGAVWAVFPYFKQDGPLMKFGSSIRTLYANTPKQAALKREARQAMNPGDTLETDHLRIHRFMDSVRIWDLTNAGKRAKRVDVAVVYDLDYIKGNDIATAWFEQWLSKTVAGSTFDQAVDGIKQFMEKLERIGAYPMPKFNQSQVKGIDVDPPQSVMKKVEYNVVDTPGLTLTVFATPSRVAIREVTFILNKEGKRGTYLHDVTVGNTENRKEKLALYSWVVMNESRLKQAQNLVGVKEMLKADGVPYDTFYLD